MSVAGTPLQTSHPWAGPAKLTVAGPTPDTRLQGSTCGCHVRPPSAVRTNAVPTSGLPADPASAHAVVPDVGATESTGVRDHTSAQVVPPSEVSRRVDAVQLPPAPQPDPDSDTHAPPLPDNAMALSEVDVRSTSCQVLPASSVRSISPPGHVLSLLMHPGVRIRSPCWASQKAALMG